MYWSEGRLTRFGSCKAPAPRPLPGVYREVTKASVASPHGAHLASTWEPHARGEEQDEKS